MPNFRSLPWIVMRGKAAQITKKCTRLKCKRMPLNLSSSFMPKEKRKRPASSGSGRLLEAPPCHKQILSPALRKEMFLSVDKIVLVLYCYNKAPQDVHVVRNMVSMGLQFNGWACTVLRKELCCMNGHRVKWASSSILGSK